MIGVVNPPTLKPVPATELWVMVRFAVPLLLIVSAWLLVTPTVTLPKPMLAGITAICGCTPLPLSEIVEGELVALLTTLRLPTALPAVVGAKLTVTERLCPAGSVTGPEKPLTANPEPAMATCEMLTLPVPVFVSATAWEAEPPMRALPKFRLVALVESKYD